MWFLPTCTASSASSPSVSRQACITAPTWGSRFTLTHSFIRAVRRNTALFVTITLWGNTHAPSWFIFPVWPCYFCQHWECVWVCGTYQHTRFHGPMAVRYSCSNQGDRTDSSDLVCCVYSSHMWPRWWSQCSCSGLSDRYTHSLIVRQRETADKYLEVIQKKGIYQSSTHVIFLLFGGGTSYWEQPVSGEELAIREGTHVHPERDNLCKGRDPGEDWPYPERWHRQFWTAGWTLALLESISSGLLWTQKRCITIAACRL